MTGEVGIEGLPRSLARQSRDPLQQIMQEAAGRAAAQKIIGARNRWAKQKLPADGELLINEYRGLRWFWLPICGGNGPARNVIRVRLALVPPAGSSSAPSWVSFSPSY